MAVLNPAQTMAIPGTGYTPDYTQLIESDPAVQQWVTGRAGAVSSAGANRRAAVRALALNYGGLPPGFVDTYGDLTPDILSQAAANPESQQAQQGRTYAAAQQQLQAGLAARGALHSGDLVQGMSQLDTNNAASLYNAAQAFGNAYGADVGSYLNDPTVAGFDASRAGIYGDAATRQAGLHPPVDPTMATLVENWNTQYGIPVYAGADGSLYSIDPSTGSLVPYSRDPSITTDPVTGLPTDSSGNPVDPVTGKPLPPPPPPNIGFMGQPTLVPQAM